MSSPKHTWTEQQFEKIVGNLLRVGVILAAVVVFGGGALYLIRAEATSPIIECSTASRQTCAAYPES